MTSGESADMPAVSGAVELEAAKVAARKAIYADGRGMIGAERNYLEYRVARAILSESARANAAEAELATLRADNERLGRERDEREIEHRAQIADMSERFRAVNIERVIEQSGQDIFELVARVAAAEAERDTLLAQVGRLREIIARYGDRMRMSYAPAHLQQDIDEAFTAETRAALTKEPSAGRSLLKENPNG